MSQIVICQKPSSFIVNKSYSLFYLFLFGPFAFLLATGADGPAVSFFLDDLRFQYVFGLIYARGIVFWKS